MSTKSKRIQFKLVSLMLMLIFIFNVFSIPLSAIDSYVATLSGSSGDTQSSQSLFARSSSLDEIQAPYYGTNPNTLINNYQVLPIYTTGVYNYLRDYSSEFTSYGQYSSRNELRSQYYTGSMLIHGNISENSKNASTSSLPYTEERSLMYHPELTASGDGYLSGVLYAEDYEYSTPNGDSIWNYLDPEQVVLRFSGTVISGNGELRVSYRKENSSAHDYQIFNDEFTFNTNSQGYKTTLKQLEDGETYNLTTTIPISPDSYKFDVSYHPWNNSIITDAHAALIDDGAPYVKDIHFEMIKGLRNDEADLVMTLTFNEGIRYLSGYDLEKDYSKTYVTVSVWNATKGEEETIKLYLDNVDGGKTVTFRANIGKLHYHDLHLKQITSFHLPQRTHRPINSGFMDLVDGMVIGVGRVKNYGNAVTTTKNTVMTNGVNEASFLADHAGNPVNFDNLRGWNVNSYKFLSDSFEAEKIEIYNDKTLGIISGDIEENQAKISDSYIGPQRDMTIYLWTDKVLTEEVWQQVYITLNILDNEGNELKIYPTSASEYTDNEVYADGVKKGMLLKFENITVSSDMTINVADGADPQIIVTGMGTDYTREETGYPTAYPYVPAPNNIMYADLNPPTVEVRKTVERTDETETAGKFYKVSCEITASDGNENQKVSGLEGAVLLLSLVGGVEEETPIRYLLSTDPTPPENNEDYIKSALLSPNGKISIGQITLINSSERFYLHILTESGGIYVNDLEIIANLSDIVGNGIETEISNNVEYIIDEIAPTVSIDSKRATAGENNSTVNLTVNISAKDHTRVDRLLYCFGSDTLVGDEEWQVAEIDDFGSIVTATVSREYGDPNSQNPDVNRIYSETLWVKAFDMYGNESQPTKVEISLSLQKPSTVVKYSADPNKINRGGELLVSGPERSSFDGSDAYTRVTITPMENSEYSYVTLVKTEENDVDILALSGLVWYRVRIEDGLYKEVSAPVDLSQNYSGDLLDGLLNCYGEIKISFENGYGNMTPALGSVSAMANAGSYISDPYYYTVRYSSPLNSNSSIHHVDFGNIVEFAVPEVNESSVIQVGGNVIVEDADKGASVYAFYQVYKGVNPMRNTQIHYSISNIANETYGLLDFDYQASYAELIKAGEDGSEDTVVAIQKGLWATGNQYFTIKPIMDNGEHFTTGAYYLRVTVVSGSGCKNSYESSRLVLDAQTADNAGLWEYSYGSVENITALDGTRYAQVTKTADSTAFDNIGISVVSGGGETSRDRLFATYSYGVDGLKLVLSAKDTTRIVEGVEVGKVEGFKIWNLLSAPTEEEISAKKFELTDGTDTLVREAVTGTIYNSETIPKGILGMSKLFLTKGTNIICYQVKMANGYVSPVRQFTVTVTDEVPQLSIAIGGYQPSIESSQIDGVINADHIRYYIDTAYSVNGTGNVSVNLWSTYDMNLGLLDENGNISDTFTDSAYGTLQVLYEGMQIGEYADFTENSYTANFPKDSIARCSAVFVVTDEYGGVSIVAPQIGDIERINVDAGNVGNAHEIDIEYYGDYFDDPYDQVFSPYGWRIKYNQVQYFGAQILGFETYLAENTSEGEIRVKDIQESDESLRYNLFNINSNDISMSDGKINSSENYVSVEFDEYENGNKEYILLSDATVTLFGGYIGNEPVTLSFLDGDVITLDESGETVITSDEGNTVGYMHGYLSADGLKFYVANPRADENHPVGTTVDLNYILRYSNQYGDEYEHSGSITLTYIEYRISGVNMTESGAKLNFSFAAKDLYNSDIERTGIFSAGVYKVRVPDYFGNSLEYNYTVDKQADLNTFVGYENYKNTAEPVIIKLMGNYDIYVDITDYAAMSVENNGTSWVTVKIYENTRFSYRYDDLTGYISTHYINVDNIYKPSPKIKWNYNKDSYNVSEDGTKYRYGSVTVYLTDNNFTLVDRYTGQIPTFTFLPGADSSYTFSKEDIVARLGDEEVELDNDITVALDIVLYEVPSIEFSDEDDNETPNVQVKAYSKLNDAYFETKMLMRLTGIRNSTVFSEAYGYEFYEYVGNRANMSDILDRMGWSTSYRFTLETVDSNQVRMFIKEGLYADAPDYNSGRSDIIEGVELNSKLLTVTKNTKFTLFVVDSANNYSSVAFNITNISNAPVPTVTKIPVSHDEVRLYIIAPEGVAEEEFKILSPEYKVDTDTESPYYLKKYIEISENDNYDIIYELKYEGTTVTDTLDAVSVTEISLDEIAMQELSWSPNKASEATPNEVSVDIRFSHNVAKINALQDYDPDKVRFEIAGNNVRVIYSDNHSAISFSAIADNSTYVYVELDSVTNIDKTAPNISLVSEELAPNGKSLVLTLSSNERASFKENNGAVGDAVTDEFGNTLYYYIVRITENGEFTFTFTDMSGIMTTFVYETNALILDGLTVWYNTSPVIEGAVTDPYQLSLESGDKIYINPVRNATVRITGSDGIMEMTGGEWFEFTIPNSSGGISPYAVYTDEFGNTLTHQFSLVEIPDSTPPEIIISKKTYAIRVGTDRAEIEEALIANMVAFDDKDDSVHLAVEFTDNIETVGPTTVKYMATDTAGNTSVAYGKLRITSIYEPEIYIAGNQVLRDEGVHLKETEDVKLSIDTKGVAYKVILTSGILTSAQMKNIESLDGYIEASEVNLGILQKGLYTVLVVTEQREYFRILISVEDF